jgi:uncharacterized protein YacL
LLTPAPAKYQPNKTPHIPSIAHCAQRLTMLDAIIILSFILAGAGIGYRGIEALPLQVQSQVSNLEALRLVVAPFGGLLGVAFGVLAQTSYRRLEKQIKGMTAASLLSRSVGLVLGLLIANLLLAPIFLLPIPSEFSFIKPLTAAMGSILFVYLGISLADTHGQNFLRLINPNSVSALLLAEGTLQSASAKVLDTSCIIDGRIHELLRTNFVEGQLLVPHFVLEELQTLADAANDQKRSRGRRGLDILNTMRSENPDRVVIHPADYPDIITVDNKLIRLAQEINGTLLTTDYNLNKVATVQDIIVLNINDLAQALRPTYIPGDKLDLKVLKSGKEPTQGIGYLQDGTMVVVEEGKPYLGTEIQVVVTSALQTSAGRMIFARPSA